MNPLLPQRLSEVVKLFLKLGMTAFGGPTAHIAMMHDETVKRRKWLSDQEFLDLVGATNLIPGPNSTEMAIHIGFLRAGWRGLIIAGACFIVLGHIEHLPWFDRSSSPDGSIHPPLLLEIEGNCLINRVDLTPPPV